MVVAFPKPNIGFYTFIDEAGDFGIKPISGVNVRQGSHWFVLGAVAVSADNVSKLSQWCLDIKERCGVPHEKALHYRDLSDDKKIIACKTMATLPIRCFVYCSHKQNMRGYRNERAAAKSNERSWFYNSSVKYLLERVTDFGLQWSIEKFGEPKHVEICLAEHPFVSVSRLADYLEKEQGNIRAGIAVHTKRQMKWQVLNVGKIIARKSEQEAGLQLADIVASAFFSSLEGVSNARAVSALPAISLRERLWNGTVGNSRKFGISNNGLTVFPPYRPLKLTEGHRTFFTNFGVNID